MLAFSLQGLAAGMWGCLVLLVLVALAFAGDATDRWR